VTILLFQNKHCGYVPIKYDYGCEALTELSATTIIISNNNADVDTT
jgi:hypothetical protein